MAKKKKVQSYEEYPFEDLNVYAGIDCIVTSDLTAKLMPMITDKPVYIESHAGKERKVRAPSIISEELKVKKTALEFMVDMEVNGILYDQALNRRMDSEMREEVAILEDKLFSTLPISKGEFNFNSDAHLSNLLYSKMGFETEIFTKTGAMATSGDALKDIHEKTGHEWLMDLKRRNDVASIHSSFISTYLEDWVKADGRVHPNYNLHGTSSHRISCDNPNLLNLPNPIDRYNVRQCYIVPMGQVFITFDFSSCEVKVLAALCKDPNMLKAIREGMDFHSYTASAINGVPYEDFVAIIEDKSHSLHKKYKALRQAAKAVTFGILFGSTVRSIAFGLGISQSEGENLVALYFKLFPRIQEFVEDCHRMAMLNHMVYTPFGQRKMQFGTYDCFKYTAVYNAALRNSQNVRIQGPASTLGLMSFSELNRINKPIGAKSLATVYDSIEIQSPLRAAAQVIENGFGCMDDWPQQEFDWLDFPIGADAEIGFNWGDVVPVHRGITQEEIEAELRTLDPEKYAACVAAAA